MGDFFKLFKKIFHYFSMLKLVLAIRSQKKLTKNVYLKEVKMMLKKEKNHDPLELKGNLDLPKSMWIRNPIFFRVLYE